MSETDNDRNGQPLLELQQVTKVYGTGIAAMQALAGVSLRIDKGEFVAVMGPSGSGKSTCMNILGCMDQPTAGRYLFQDVDVGRLTRDQRTLLRRHYLGFVFQGFNLLNRTSALENVELPLIYRGIGREERHAAAFRALDTVGLRGWEHHMPNELSGGQIGIVLALLASRLLATVLQVPWMLNLPAIAVAFAFSASVGVIFGYMPARKAARMDPIEALRHE